METTFFQIFCLFENNTVKTFPVAEILSSFDSPDIYVEGLVERMSSLILKMKNSNPEEKNELHQAKHRI